jgi:stearoyl-CoA desaturase (delta-9 desaturase)
MTQAQRYTNLAAVVLPLLAFIVAIVLLWNRIVGWHDLVLLGVLYVLTGLGITVGFHRMLTHRSFQTSTTVERIFAVLGSLAVQGSVIQWVSDHRKHHAHTDEEGDPHSPHAGYAGGGIMGTLRGLLHAHVGWILTEQGGENRAKYAKDLVEDPGMKRISDNFHLLVLASLALPTALGFALSGGEVKGALTGLLWGGFVRIFLLHHVTWSINSICHFFGTRRFDVDDHLRRGLAPQPPHLPALGRARPQALGEGDGPVGRGDRGDGEAWLGVERRADHAGAPAGEDPGVVVVRFSSPTLFRTSC